MVKGCCNVIQIINKYKKQIQILNTVFCIKKPCIHIVSLIVNLFLGGDVKILKMLLIK